MNRRPQPQFLFFSLRGIALGALVVCATATVLTVLCLLVTQKFKAKPAVSNPTNYETMHKENASKRRIKRIIKNLRPKTTKRWSISKLNLDRLPNKEQQLHRKSRSVTYQYDFKSIKKRILFFNHQQMSEITAFFHRGLCLLSKRCSGYDVRMAQLIPPIDVVRRCRFAHGFEDNVPTMIHISHAGNLIRSASYSCYKEKYLKHTHCLIDQGTAECARGCDNGKDDVGWGCTHNFWMMHGVKAFADCDYLNHYSRTPGDMLKFLCSECSISFYWTKYYAFDWDSLNSFLYVFAHYARCISHNINCPKVCNKADACTGEMMLTKCYEIYEDDNFEQKKIHPMYKWIRPAFNKIRYCPCYEGFEYDFEKEKCVSLLKPCSKGDECLNSGRCEPLDEEAVSILGRIFDCECKPAWQGIKCEERRDPCLVPKNHRSCATVPGAECQRNPEDEVTGFICICPDGFSMGSKFGSPTCIDIDECAVSMPCKNGANCENLAGSFKCKCNFGFSGSRCQYPPPMPHWLPWNSWSACSVTCSTGMQTKRRVCNVHGACLGIKSQSRICAGEYLDCDGADSSNKSSDDSDRVGWQEEEDKVQDDSFFFREYENLKLGFRLKEADEEEELLLSDVEILVTESLVTLSIIAAVLFIVLLVRKRKMHFRRTKLIAKNSNRINNLDDYHDEPDDLLDRVTPA